MKGSLIEVADYGLSFWHRSDLSSLNGCSALKEAYTSISTSTLVYNVQRQVVIKGRLFVALEDQSAFEIQDATKI